MPTIDWFADLEEHLLQGMGAGDGIPVDEAGTDHNSFEAEAIEVAEQILERQDTGSVLRVGKRATVIFEPPL